MDIFKFEGEPFNPSPIIPKLASLSPRQKQLVHFLVQCRKREDIAKFYNISSKGLEWHIYRIFSKLGIGSIIELVIVATKGNFVYQEPDQPTEKLAQPIEQAVKPSFTLVPLPTSRQLSYRPQPLLLTYPVVRPKVERKQEKPKPIILPAPVVPKPTPPVVPVLLPKVVIPKPAPQRTLKWLASYIEDVIETDCVNARVSNRLSYWIYKLRHNDISGDDLLQLEGVITTFGKRLNKNYSEAISFLQNTGCKTQPHEQCMAR